MKKEIVGLIPVKGESDRVPQKNIRHFSGTNLLKLKLEQLKDAEGFSSIIVSSEDERILKIASENGYETHVRDPDYSTSEVPMSEVYSYIGNSISGDHIAWINVTNPLVTSAAYTEALKQYDSMSDSFDCLLSAYEIRSNIFWKNQPLNFKAYPWPRSQDLDPAIILSFAISLRKREDLIKQATLVGSNPNFYLLDQIMSWDIDSEEDFELCELIHQHKISDN